MPKLTEQRVREINVMSMDEFLALPVAERRAYARIPVPPERQREIMRELSARYDPVYRKS